MTRSFTRVIECPRFSFLARRQVHEGFLFFFRIYKIVFLFFHPPLSSFLLLFEYTMTQNIELTFENLQDALANDTRIKVAAVDIDGLLRGKIIHKEKFLQVVKSGFGKYYLYCARTYTSIYT